MDDDYISKPSANILLNGETLSFLSAFLLRLETRQIFSLSETTVLQAIL